MKVNSLYKFAQFWSTTVVHPCFTYDRQSQTHKSRQISTKPHKLTDWQIISIIWLKSNWQPVAVLGRGQGGTGPPKSGPGPPQIFRVITVHKLLNTDWTIGHSSSARCCLPNDEGPVFDLPGEGGCGGLTPPPVDEDDLPTGIFESH